MNCALSQEAINHFIDGEMDTRRHVELFQHLATCTNCQSFIDTMVHVKEASRNEPIPYPADLDDAVLGEILSVSTRHLGLRDRLRAKPAFWRYPIAIPIPVGASLIIVMIALGLFIGRMFAPQSELIQHFPAMQTNSTQPQTVILIYGMPPIEVVGTPTIRTLEGHRLNNN